MSVSRPIPGGANVYRLTNMAKMHAREKPWRVLVFDIAPAAGFLSMGLLDLYTGLTIPYGDAPKSSALLSIIVACTALVFRRRWPLAVLIVIVAVVVLPALFTPVLLTLWGQFVTWIFAMYSVGRHETWERAVWAPLIALTGFGAVVAHYPGMHIVTDIIMDAVLLLGAWGIGRVLSTSVANRTHAHALELERARAEERAALSERTRIARELHDVISHSITVIVMQAGGARMASATDPRAATDALAQIETVGREALRELGTMLAVLRDDDGGPAPQPSLADIATLCERMGPLGMSVTVDVSENCEDVSAGVQLTAYRIVQESLTNILKHAGPVDTSVAVTRTNGELEVRVTSASGQHDRELTGSTLGLVGLRERVDAYGGELEAGPSAHGFGIRAVLPTAVSA